MRMCRGYMLLEASLEMLISYLLEFSSNDHRLPTGFKKIYFYIEKLTRWSLPHLHSATASATACWWWTTHNTGGLFVIIIITYSGKNSYKYEIKIHQSHSSPLALLRIANPIQWHKKPPNTTNHHEIHRKCSRILFDQRRPKWIQWNNQVISEYAVKGSQYPHSIL